ncbi:MAG: FecR domain-containing protein [Steroidobacteraceae bacterium]
MVGVESSVDEQILQAAIRWHEASSRSDCDWEALTAWLEADAAHQQAYADVALLNDQVARQTQQLQGARAVMQLPSRLQRAWPAALVAAAVAAVALLLAPLQPLTHIKARSYQADTRQSRSIELDDGSKILLAPGSSLRVSGWHHDHVELAGVAYFDVPHDPERTLILSAGEFSIRDIGTRFEVVSSARELKVAVAEGSVTVDLPGGAGSVQVNAGRRLLVSGELPVAEYASIAAADVAGWREGRLVFHNEPLSMVVQQISPHAGVTVTVDAAIAARRFSGVLAIGDGSQLVSRLEEIMGLVGQREAAAVHLSAAALGP